MQSLEKLWGEKNDKYSYLQNYRSIARLLQVYYYI